MPKLLVSGLVVFILASVLSGCGGGGSSSSTTTSANVAVTSVAPTSVTANTPVTVIITGTFNEPGNYPWYAKFFQNGQLSSKIVNYTTQWVSTTEVTVTLTSNSVLQTGTYDIQVQGTDGSNTYDSPLTSADQITFN